MNNRHIQPVSGLILIVLSVLFLPVSCKEGPLKKRMDHFKWMIGSWSSERQSGRMVERWEAGTDSTMSGAAVLVQPDGTTQAFEQISLVLRNGEFFYVVTSAQDSAPVPVSFQLTSYSDSGFVAENQSHDFPKRIIYKYIAPDSLLATIDAGPAQPEEKVDFRFSRERP